MDSLSNQDRENGIVLYSKISLARNFSNIPFPNKLNLIKGRDNGKNVYNTLKSDLLDEDIALYEIWNTKDEFNRQFIDKDLISEELLKNSDKGSFILNNEETICVMINEKNHVNIQCIKSGLNLDEAYYTAADIDDKIEKNFNYAFDERLGYLTTSPESVGTGMKASVILHLPAITMSEEIKNISKRLSEEGMTIKGVYLDGTKTYGNLYRIVNKQSLGLSEEDILIQLKETVRNIISEEHKFREVLLSKCRYELEDKVYRAYGILKHAILLDSKEIIDLLSNVRLGAELSIIDVDESKLDKLMTLTSNSSLKNYLGKHLDDKEIKYERAILVKEILL